ncbi:MAG TPA: serine protein kinase RIO, partial [Gammaproteobacteria bacterium]|nr:serine protein kinase RIO [Gammaproteobacteria bacterium]
SGEFADSEESADVATVLDEIKAVLAEEEAGLSHLV